MKCKLCNKYFSYEIKFDNLFKNVEICESCKSYYIPKLREELIPISGGYIKYYYLFDNIPINQIQKHYLSKYFSILYDIICNLDSSNLILIIDDLNYEELVKELPFILLSKKIYFLSLVRYNFENFVYFN